MAFFAFIGCAILIPHHNWKLQIPLVLLVVLHLGATVTGIFALLSKDFLKLVLLSLVLASPIAWYFMSDWLNDFAFRIKLSWWIFLAAGSIALLIALATVSFQAIKAANANPVKSLRTE